MIFESEGHDVMGLRPSYGHVWCSMFMRVVILIMMDRIIAMVDRIIAMVDRIIAMMDRIMAMMDRIITMMDRIITMMDRIIAMMDRIIVMMSMVYSMVMYSFRVYILIIIMILAPRCMISAEITMIHRHAFMNSNQLTMGIPMIPYHNCMIEHEEPSGLYSKSCRPNSRSWLILLGS